MTQTQAQLLPATERHTRRVWLLAAIAFVACFALITRFWWIPVQEISDQNAYLVAALNIAKAGSPEIRPVNPLTGARDDLRFIGSMWVGTDLGTPEERHYPKYPLGTPLLYAGLLKIGGKALLYLAPAMIMAGALLAAYLLMRRFIGPAWALPCLIALASSPAIIRAIRSTKSHGLSMLCICVGLWLLIEWWYKGGRSRALAAGLALGYAVIVRYTDGLMLLPMLLIIALRYPGTDRRRWLGDASTMLLVWSLFPAAQLAFNLATTGMITGYSQTNESTSFAIRAWPDYWHTIRHLFLYGITLCVPIGALGMLWGLRKNWRLVLVLIVTTIPTVVLFGCYSWHLDDPSAAFARFFTAILPLFVIASACLILNRWQPADDERPTPRWRGLTLCLLLAATATWNLWNAIPATRAEYLTRLNLACQREMLDRVAPPDAVVIGPNTLLNDVQFSRDGWYLIRKQVLLRQNLATAPLPAVGARRSVILRGMPFAKVPAVQRPAAMTGAIADLLHAGRRVFLVAEEDEKAIVLDRSRLQFAQVRQYRVAERIPAGLPTLAWNPSNAFANYDGATEANGRKWTLYELKPTAAP